MKRTSKSTLFCFIPKMSLNPLYSIPVNGNMEPLVNVPAGGQTSLFAGCSSLLFKNLHSMAKTFKWHYAIFWSSNFFLTIALLAICQQNAIRRWYVRQKFFTRLILVGRVLVLEQSDSILHFHVQFFRFTCHFIVLLHNSLVQLYDREILSTVVQFVANYLRKVVLRYQILFFSIFFLPTCY